MNYTKENTEYIIAEYQSNPTRETVERLSEVSNKLNQVISGINNGEGSLGKLAKDEELYNNLNKTSQNINSLILDLKENPKRYINISVFGKK